MTVQDIVDYIDRSVDEIVTQERKSIFYPFIEEMEASVDILLSLKASIRDGFGPNDVLTCVRDYDNDEDSEKEYYYWFTNEERANG